jgi:hypothetical protein
VHLHWDLRLKDENNKNRFSDILMGNFVFVCFSFNFLASLSNLVIHINHQEFKANFTLLSLLASLEKSCFH